MMCRFCTCETDKFHKDDGFDVYYCNKCFVTTQMQHNEFIDFEVIEIYYLNKRYTIFIYPDKVYIDHICHYDNVRVAAVYFNDDFKKSHKSLREFIARQLKLQGIS